MDQSPPKLRKSTLNGLVFVSTAERLIIRIPLVGYVAIVGMLLLTTAVMAVLVWTGLMNMAWETFWFQQSLMAAGIFFFSFLWGRWWTFDRKSDRVRFFPWPSIKLSAIESIGVGQRLARRKYTNYTVYFVEFHLTGGARARLRGYFSSLGEAWARDFAGKIGEWLNVPVRPTLVDMDKQAQAPAASS